MKHQIRADDTFHRCRSPVVSATRLAHRLETCGETVQTRGCHSHPTHGLTREDVLAQIGTTMTRFDASNAFMSVHHTTLEKLVEASFEDEMDRSLMKQRYRGAQISPCATSDGSRVEIVPSCGAFCPQTY